MSEARPRTVPPRTALLLAAHGERRAGAGNAGAMRLAAALSARRMVDEVAVGFIKGVPPIEQAVGAFMARRILVYPLFLSDGYFTRVRLARALDNAALRDAERRMDVLPPLGLDPGLPDLIVGHLAAARLRGPLRDNLVLLAHGSGSNPASRIATEQVAEAIARRGCFGAVRCAFLDEAPGLSEAIADLYGPVAVFGLLAGEGRHAAEDVPRLIAALGRPDIALAGSIAQLHGIERLVAAAVTRALGVAHRHPLAHGLPAMGAQRLNASRCGSSPGR